MKLRNFLAGLCLFLFALPAFATDCYVDYSTGNDTTGDGSTGTPYKTAQKCMNTLTTGGGHRILLANTAAHVLTGNLDWTAGFSGVGPLTLEPWDNGGSITVTTGDGTEVLGAEIDGNSLVGQPFGSAGLIPYIQIRGIHFKNFVIYSLYSSQQNWRCYQCEFSGSPITSHIRFENHYSEIIDSSIVGDGVGTETGIYLFGYSLIDRTHIQNVPGTAIILDYLGSTVSDTLIHDVGSHGIDITTYYNNYISNNTIDGSNVAGKYGIYGSTNGVDNNHFTGNLLTNWTGAGSAAIFSVAGSDCGVVGPNAYYNNTANNSCASVQFNLGELILTADPYVDRSLDNFTVSNTSDAYEALSQGISFGAYQNSVGGVSGGGAAGSSFIIP